MSYYIFDLDSTLCEKFTGADLLPGRTEMLQKIYGQGGQIAIASNQGSMGAKMACIAENWGDPSKYETAATIEKRFTTIKRNLQNTGFSDIPIAISYSWQAKDDIWYEPMELHRPEIGRFATRAHRKPSAGMLEWVCEQWSIQAHEAHFIGDAYAGNGDEKAAESIGMPYYDEKIFFKKGAIIL